MDDSRREHLSRTRYVRPVEAVTFSGSELVSSLVASAGGAAGLLSINQLHGERRGTVRVSLRTAESAAEFDQRLATRKVHVNGVRVAAVGDSGHFIKVSLLDVPEYLSSLAVERALRDYGPVAHVKREYLEVQGYKIENETRHVFFSLLLKELPPKLQVEGQDVFVLWPHKTGSQPTSKPGRSGAGVVAGGGQGAEEAAGRASRQAVSPAPSSQSTSTGPVALPGPNHQHTAEKLIKQIKDKQMPSPIVSPEAERAQPEVGSMSLPLDPKRGLVEILDSPGMSRRTFNVEVQVQPSAELGAIRDVTDQQTTDAQHQGTAEAQPIAGTSRALQQAETTI